MCQFSHGGDIISFAKELGCRVDDIIDLSSNINFLKPEIKIDFNDIKIDFYPSYDTLFSSLASFYKIESNQIELYNGGSSAIFALMSYFDEQNCTIYSPAYLEYKKAAIKLGKSLELVNRFVELKKDIIPNSIVIFVNPSTPDGSFYDIKELLQLWKEKNCKVIIDESFLEFTNYCSSIKYLDEYDNLYILKSLTKFYSCAGVRVGVVLSTKENISKLKDKEPLWKISQYDSIYIQEVLKDKSFRKISLATNAKSKAYLEQILSSSKLFDSFLPSFGNFILAHLRTITVKNLQDKLKSYKIMVRDCSNFDFLDEKYVRIAVKSSKDLKQFENAIKDIEENL